MVFSSIPFLFYFLPALIIIHSLVPKPLKNGVMIFGSLLFLAWGEMRFVPIIVGLSILDYTWCRLIGRYHNHPRRRLFFLILSITINLCVLVYFKYTNFFVANLNQIFGLSIPDPNILVPLGVSFSTFQNVSYTVDVYRGKTPAEKNYYNYLCYTTLFPQIIAGPIVRYVTVSADLAGHRVTRDRFSAGMRRFIIGLGKKVLIANQVGQMWAQIAAGQSGDPSVLLYWMGIVAYTFQIYFDFSGYSDMAIGLAQVFGLTFEENFDFPYAARSITEFWRRWHMTLSAWFRDYVYIPMGGNRRGLGRQTLNILVVWALTGLWHGASWNFLIWGLYFAAILLLEKFLLFRFWDKVPRILQHVYTMLIVMISWLIFASGDLKGITMPQYLAGMFGLSRLPLYTNQAVFYLLGSLPILIAAAYFCTPHFRKTVIARTERTENHAVWGVTTAVYLLVFAASVAFIVGGSYNPFLYYRF